MVLFTRVSKATRAAAEAAVQRHGVRLGQNLLLEALWERDGRTPGELAGLMRVTTPTVVKMAQRMETAGLVTRRRDDADNRLVRLYLTERGREVKKPMEEEFARLHGHLLSGVTDEERRHFMSVLTKLLGNAESLGAGPGSDG